MPNKKRPKTNDIQHPVVVRQIDAVLWVGNAAGKYRTVDQFAVEAGLRGCCRRLPEPPAWMKPGKTLIFLAHRNRHKNKKHGSLFGYFVLHRLEIIADQKASSIQYGGDPNTLWPRDPGRYINWIKALASKSYAPDKIKAALRKKLRREHPPKMARGKVSHKPKGAHGPDFDLLEEILKEIIKEYAKEHFPRHDSTRGEGHRACSLRGKPGAVYAVDALCAAIHETYQAELRRIPENKRTEALREIERANNKLWKSWLTSKRRTWDPDQLLDHYSGPFQGAVKEHHPWKPEYPVDPRLKSKSTRHGELVCFQAPYPMFERVPQAAFRGILQVDGNALIRQLATYTGGSVAQKIKLQETKACGSDSGKIETQSQLACLLAQELDLNKACANRVLKKIAEVAQQQLASFQKFKLEGIGTIRAETKNAEKKITFDPSTKIT